MTETILITAAAEATAIGALFGGVWLVRRRRAARLVTEVEQFLRETADTGHGR